MRVAEQVFLASGFTATTMQMIAEKAGASKETLYRHFGSKETLFAAIISARALALRETLEADFDRPDAMGEVLRDLGTRLMVHLCGPEVTCILRIVISEQQRDAELGRIFMTQGPERTRNRLTEYLEAAAKRGEFKGSDPALAASIFLAAITGQSHLIQLTLGHAPLPAETDVKARVDEVVALFLGRYG